MSLHPRDTDIDRELLMAMWQREFDSDTDSLEIVHGIAELEVEPAARSSHSTAVVEESLFLWAGDQAGMLRVHDSAEKRAFLSRVEIFNLQRGSWESQTRPLVEHLHWEWVATPA